MLATRLVFQSSVDHEMMAGAEISNGGRRLNVDRADPLPGQSFSRGGHPFWIAFAWAIGAVGLAWSEEVPLQRWNLQIEQPSVGRVVPGPNGSLTVQLDRVEGTEAWRVSLTSDKIDFDPGYEYSFTFEAKAALDRTIELFACQLATGSRLLSDARPYAISTEWKPYLFVFRPDKKEMGGRLQMVLGSSRANLSLRALKLERRPTTAPDPERAGTTKFWTLSFPSGSKARLIEASSPSKSALIRMDADASTHAWQINIHRAGFALEPGREYLVRFRARAAYARSVDMMILRDRAPWTLVAPVEEIPLTTEWQTFEIPFACQTGEPRGMMQFNLGGSLADVQIEGLEVIESASDHDLDEIPFLRNQWSLSLVPENRARLIRPLHGGSMFKVMIDQAPTLERWHINLLYSPIRILGARDYHLRFRIRAAEDRVLSFRLDDQDGESLGLFKLISVGTAWQEVEVPFRSLGETSAARLVFELGGSDADVEIGNVTLEVEPRSVISLDRTRTVLVNLFAVAGSTMLVAWLVSLDFRRRREEADRRAAQSSGL